MSDIAASTVTTDENPVEISMVVQPPLAAVASVVRGDPLEGGPGVMVSCGERVIGGETVFD